eukprot:1144547-Prymnesium_polylepis.1
MLRNLVERSTVVDKFSRLGRLFTTKYASAEAAQPEGVKLATNTARWPAVTSAPACSKEPPHRRPCPAGGRNTSTGAHFPRIAAPASASGE